MKKRLLAMILCIMMIVTAIPLTFIPGLASGEEATKTVSVTHEDLYVKGATFKWDAFDLSSTDEPITAFENQMTDNSISIPVAVTMGDQYVVYPKSEDGIDLKSYIPSQKVGNYYLPDDYTVEMTVHQHWDASYTVANARWNISGMGTGDYWGGQFNFTLQTPSDTRGYIETTKTFFALMNDDGTLTDYWDNVATWSEVFSNLTEKPYTVGWTNVSTFSNGETYHPCVNVPHRDGALRIDLKRNHYLRESYYDDLNDKGFVVGTNTPFAYYAIRIYPFALTMEQTVQNHFAELCDYFNVDEALLSSFVSLDEISQKEIRNDYIGVTFDETSKEAIEKTIGDKIKELSEAEENAALKELYKSLYVEDGAEFVWNAFLYGAVKGGYMIDLFDETKTLGDGSVGIEKKSGFEFASYAGKLDFTPFLQEEDGTYIDAFNLEIGLRLTSDYGKIDRFFGPLGHLSNNNNDENSKYTYTSEKRTDGYESFGMIKTPYRVYPLATVAREIYYFKGETDTVPITKAAYDMLSATEKEAYTLNVEVPYYTGSYAMAFDQPGHWYGHVLGNYTNETYSFGLSMHFDKGNNSFGFAFLRDSEQARGRTVAKEGLLYVPGQAYSGNMTFTPPTSYEAAKNNSALQNVTCDPWTTADRGFYFGSSCAEYYSIHIYNKELTDMQRKQNHFADLVSCFKPRNIEDFVAFSTEQKEAVYTLLSEREDIVDEVVRNNLLRGNCGTWRSRVY